MPRVTKQMKKWKGNFGIEYTKRNILDPDEENESCRKRYGVTQMELNNLFIGRLDPAIKILEVGSNIGNQLLLLQRMGFKNLYGIEINDFAIEFSKSRTKNIEIIQGSIFDIPFKDESFDLVFTAGVLIHIAPSDIKMAMQEVYRCAREYIWAYEYYAKKYTEIVYRTKKKLLWKADFPKLYLDFFRDLELVKEKQLQYLDDENIDIMFLLKRRFTGGNLNENTGR